MAIKFNGITISNLYIGSTQLNKAYLGSTLVFNRVPVTPSSLLTGITNYYKLDETSGTVATDSVGSNNATLDVGAFNAGGKINYGYYNVTNTTTALNYGNNFNLTTDPITINGWFKFTAGPSSSMLFSKDSANDQGWYLYIPGDGKLQIDIKTASLAQRLHLTNGPTITALNTWMMFTLVYDGTGTVAGTKVYIDGEEITFGTVFADTMAGFSAVNTVNFLTGAYNRASISTRGYQDEIAMWDRALTDSEINQLYFGNQGNQYPFSTANPLTGGLEHYYKLDETSGTAVADSVGTANGTVVSGSLVSGGKINYGWYNSNTTTTGLNVGSSFNNLFDRLTPWSINLWVKRDTLGTTQLVYSSEESASPFAGMFLAVNTSNQLYLNYAASATNNITINPIAIPFTTTGVWQMLTVTYTGSGSASGFKFYSNSTNYTGTVTSDDLTTSPVSSDNLLFGQYGRSAIYGFRGDQDEIGIWDRALTASEITELYNSSVGMQYPFDATPANPLVDGLQSYYKMDETTGNTLDSVGSNDGVNTNITHQAGKINNGNYYNGGNTKYTSFFTTSTATTLSFWIKTDNIPSAATANEFLFDGYDYNNRYYTFLQSASDRLLITGNTTTLFELSTVDTAKIWSTNWEHVVIVYKSGGSKIYLNGSLLDTSTATFSKTAGGLTIGETSDGVAELNGMVDELGSWDRELSASEISELYNANVGYQYPFAI